MNPRTILPALPLLSAVLLVLAPLAPASAHADLVSSNPKDGARLDTLPHHVRLEFSEDMQQPAYVVVTAADGSKVTTGKPAIDGTVVTQRLGKGPAGAYTVAYRAVSGDGHPVSGELSFRVAGSDAPASAQAAPAQSSTAPASDDRDFWARHGTHVIVGAVLLVLAAALLIVSRRRPQ